MFYSSATNGFYREEIHGSQKICINDPAWVRPTKNVTLLPGETYPVVDQVVTNESDTPLTLKDVPDWETHPDTIEIDNPECKIPADAREITDEYHALLLTGQSEGKIIAADEGGYPILVDPPKATVDQMCERIKAERDRRRFDGGIKVNDHWFLSTSIAAGEYTSLAVLSVGLPEQTVLRANWRTMDGSKVDITPVLVKQILAAGFAQVAAIDDAAQAHKTALEGSATPALYDFSAAWPKVFGE